MGVVPPIFRRGGRVLVGSFSSTTLWIPRQAVGPVDGGRSGGQTAVPDPPDAAVRPLFRESREVQEVVAGRRIASVNPFGYPAYPSLFRTSAALFVPQLGLLRKPPQRDTGPLLC